MAKPTFQEWLESEKEAAVIDGDRAALEALCGTRDEADKLTARRGDLVRREHERRHGFHQFEHALKSALSSSPV